MLGKTEGKRGRGWERMRGLDSITDSKDMTLSKLRSLILFLNHVLKHNTE